MKNLYQSVTFVKCFVSLGQLFLTESKLYGLSLKEDNTTSPLAKNTLLATLRPKFVVPRIVAYERKDRSCRPCSKWHYVPCRTGSFQLGFVFVVSKNTYCNHHESVSFIAVRFDQKFWSIREEIHRSRHWIKMNIERSHGDIHHGTTRRWIFEVMVMINSSPQPLNLKSWPRKKRWQHSNMEDRMRNLQKVQ